jgi:hypothetical protein
VLHREYEAEKKEMDRLHDTLTGLELSSGTLNEYGSDKSLIHDSSPQTDTDYPIYSSTPRLSQASLERHDYESLERKALQRARNTTLAMSSSGINVGNISKWPSNTGNLSLDVPASDTSQLRASMLRYSAYSPDHASTFATDMSPRTVLMHDRR